MTWFDCIIILLMVGFVGATVFCYVFTIVTLYRKKPTDSIFPKKRKTVSDVDLQKQILDFYNKFKNG